MVFFGIFDIDVGEMFGDGSGGFVDCDDVFVWGDYGLGGFSQLFDVYVFFVVGVGKI